MGLSMLCRQILRFLCCFVFACSATAVVMYLNMALASAANEMVLANSFAATLLSVVIAVTIVRTGLVCLFSGKADFVFVFALFCVLVGIQRAQGVYSEVEFEPLTSLHGLQWYACATAIVYDILLCRFARR